MSLLEDVFLEDEAGEAQELERVIEGDELDDRPRTPDSNEASEKEDEAEEDKRVVDHTAKAKRVVKNPRFVLNPARLMGPRGIQVIPEHFKDFKFKGKGHEREDLDIILKKLEHWAYRLYPKFKFDDCLNKIETLGRKRPVMVHLHKIRTDQYLSEETVQQQDSSGDEAAPAPPEDEFDRLLQQQIELARSTPAPDSARKEMRTPMSHQRSPLMLPKVSSSPSINDEQKERMMRNRRLAEERRLARLNRLNNSSTVNSTDAAENSVQLNTDTANNEENTVKDMQKMDDKSDNEQINEDKNEPVIRKHNRTNVIESDSSDDENGVMAVNESVTVDVHNFVVNNVNSEAISDKSEEVDMEKVDDATVINDDDMPVVKKQNKTNIIDSSDEENESVNEEMTTSVNVPINVHKDIASEELNSDKENETECIAIETNDNMSTESKSQENNELETDPTDINSPNNETRQNTNSDMTERTNNTVKESDIDLAEASQKLDENIDSVSVTEELMDVDFSDDF